MPEERNTFSAWEWAILLVLLAAGILASKLFGLTAVWREAIPYTIVVFAVVIMALRPAWHRRGFWQTLAGIFAIHAVLLALAGQIMPSIIGISGVPMILGGMAEALLIGGLLWKKSMGPSPKKH